MKVALWMVFMLLMVLQLTAQTSKEIKVKVRKTSLSQVLFDLKESYGFQFAFDNDLLSKYLVSVNRTFNSQSETLRFLLKNLPLELERSGDVFLIIPRNNYEDENAEVKSTKISGQVLEAQTFEPLPYSYVFINQKPIQSDQQGNFNFIASADTTFDLRISHLGYYIYDTTFTQSLDQKFLLFPQIEKIQEIMVEGNLVEKSTLIGDKPGRIKINHRIAPVLPGHGDNSVFNLLRLMPGILAAGEQSNDLLIWGGYESHSKIQFDGFTIFGLKNFNYNISVVNPFMVKNIEVMKGGYEARFGGRVGGIVDIVGKSGTLQKPSFKFNINTSTLNSLVELPLSKKASLLAAYRQTYYQLYDPASLNLFRGNDKNSNQQSSGTQQGSQQGNHQSAGTLDQEPINFTVNPDYVFRDANLKYSFRSDNGTSFALSLYGGGDKFDYDMSGDYFKNTLTRKEEEENNQFGGSVQFNQAWKNGDVTNITASYSVFKRLAEEKNQNEKWRTGRIRITKNVTSENNVDEAVLNLEHNHHFKDGHKLVLGAGVQNNNVKFLRNFFTEEIINLNTQSSSMHTYLQNELSLGNVIDLKTGIRTIFSSILKEWFFEPRVAASINVAKGLKINSSWGLYNQFLAKTSVVDSALNYSYFWTNADDEIIPVLGARHWVGGFSYNKNGFTFSTEAYHKTTDGVTRFFNGNRNLSRGFYEGDAKSYGLDFYLKKEYKKHMAWISYTRSKTEEHFPFYKNDVYKPAPHHQLHEVKLAAIINLNRFYFSTNYVYGSGFERYSFTTLDGVKLDQDYKRLDAALVYRFRPGKVRAEAGISILNVLDTENIKYSNLRRATVDEINLVGIYAEAVPFTPTVFLKIEL